MTKTLPKWRALPKLPLAKLNQIELKSGAHRARDNGLCVMEAVAWVAGEPHSDSPQCASAVISRFLRNWNDSLPNDADRSRLLRPLVPKLVGTLAGPAIELKRSWMAFDWLVREMLSAFLDLAKIDIASKLRALKPFKSKIDLDAGIPVINEAQTKSAAAGDAAWAAARDAAGDAAGKRLAPTVKKLQRSAVKLVERMIDAK